MRYKDAGVDIDAAKRAKAQIKRLARTTFNPHVLREVGAFAGFFSVSQLPRDAVLVSSVDGVGTKLKIAFALNRHTTVGADLVNHCVNDIAVHGATPLFFLDYLATGKLEPRVVTDVVGGLARRPASAGKGLAERTGSYYGRRTDGQPASDFACKLRGGGPPGNVACATDFPPDCARGCRTGAGHAADVQHGDRYDVDCSREE